MTLNPPTSGGLPLSPGALPSEPQASDPPDSRGPGLLGLVRKSTLAQPVGLIGTIIVVAWILVAVLAPLLAPHDPNVQQRGAQLLSIGSPGHLLGTDELGRDILSRLIFGARISIGIGLVAVSLGGVSGSALGLISGFFGGLVETLVMRASDIVLAYPGILLGVVIVAVLGQGTPQVAIAIAIINIPIFARLARSSVLRERELDYVAAATLGGGSWPRILFRHILPNSLVPLIVQASISVAHAVLIESSLSFLGLGAQPPTASWGAMLNESRAYLNESATFAILPGLALATLLLGLSFLADALRNALDPSTRGR
jgi:ABC-type dipeptide/oligopeptide/nickel transport system permease subunit